MNPQSLSELLLQPRPLILDGGLATELEAEGHDLRCDLWSAQMMIDNPAAIAAVHRRYLLAGADIITAATYQASLPGLKKAGYDQQQAHAFLQRTVHCAMESRDAILAELPATRIRPLVAASVGPYGAFLADGSEFRGHYGLSRAELFDFHTERWQVLAQSGAELIACETIPALDEAEVLASLIERGEWEAWLSFSCRDGLHLCDGTPIDRVAELVESTKNCIGLGINCTSPKYIEPLMQAARAAGLQKPMVIYPNSGETFDSETRAWRDDPETEAHFSKSARWLELGAKVIGGCCRTHPGHVQGLKETLLGLPVTDENLPYE